MEAVTVTKQPTTIRGRCVSDRLVHRHHGVWHAPHSGDGMVCRSGCDTGPPHGHLPAGPCPPAAQPARSAFLQGESVAEDENEKLVFVSESPLGRFGCYFRLSFRFCPSTAGCSPPSMSSIVLCLLLSCSRWFPPSLLCRLAIFYMAVLLISSLSLVATLCSVWSTYCPSFLLCVRPISTFVLAAIS